MQGFTTMKYTCGVICILVLAATLATSAPSYSDYDNNLRDLLEVLMQKEALDERLSAHQVVRKASRSPSLRLRFGRRSDPSLYPGAAYLMAQEAGDHADNN